MSDKPVLRQVRRLRRYARALTGSQAEGDVLVQAALEDLIAGGHDGAGAPLHLVMLRALHSARRRALDGRSVDVPYRRSVADVRLQSMTPELRSALLLILMEGLSTEEAAWVLGLHEEEARRRFEAAEAAVARQLATDVLIIEDEPLIAAHLERLVAEMGHAVSGLAATRAEAVALAGAAPPGLVLADIRLADGSDGIETADEIRRRRDVPVIFITAHPERLLTGRRREPAFVLAKPFAEAAVKALIGQALLFHQPRPVLRVV